MTQTFWQEKIQVGPHTVPRFMAAPLDGVTDSPLRQLIREFSKEELLFSEMRHVACVTHERDSKSLRYEVIEQPLCYQIAANQVMFIDTAIEKIAAAGITSINLNLGCPARCVVKSGGGSALMANIPQLRKILAALQQATKGVMPYSVKIRAGFKERNAEEVASIAEEYGAVALIIHPRTAPEGFTSRLDFDLAKRVKQRAAIPIIFSGNITSFARAEKTYEMTGVDGFMVGRALWGAPWKLKEIAEHAAGREFSLSTYEMISYALKHLTLNFEHYGPLHGMNMFKKQLPQYIKGVTDAASLRRDLLVMQSGVEIQKSLESLLLQYPSIGAHAEVSKHQAPPNGEQF